MFKVEEKVIDKAKHLVITIPVNEELKPSFSGKTLIVASTNGNKETEHKVNGKNVILGLNAYIRKA